MHKYETHIEKRTIEKKHKYMENKGTPEMD